MAKKIMNLIFISLLLTALVLPGACLPTRYELTTSVEPAGGGTVSPGGSYEKGSNVRVTATPNEGYIFEQWSGDASGTSPALTILINGNKTITAHFKSKEPGAEEKTDTTQITYTLKTETNPRGSGSITPNGGIFEEGTNLILSVAAASGYKFIGWGGDASGTSETTSVKMNGDKLVTAHFEKEVTVEPGAVEYTLTTSTIPEYGGAVTPPGGSYKSGTVVAVRATPVEGYIFDHWSGDASGTADTITFSMTGDMSVTAHFQMHTLTLTSSILTDGGDIPTLYTCRGQDISPDLYWSGVPEGTQSFVIIVDDPDAPQGTFTHWIIYNIPPNVRSLQENIPIQAEFSDGTKQGYNNFGDTGYGGPCPPSGERHEYKFKLYAIDTIITLSPYAATRQTVIDFIEGHTLAISEISCYFQNW